MTHRFCSACWTELDPYADRCPRCGASFNEGVEEGYPSKLVRALDHQLPDRRLVAARILGQLRVQAAVPRLLEIMRNDAGPYVTAEAVVALGRIGDQAGLKEVRRVASQGPAVVRAAAHQVLRERAE
jgi:HEAT repeat protein